ncbi:MAG: DNA internalization-related competence protein ComEC/Rec2 [Candidatus Margulisbacteria bacterium]|nr:DNA internalization-related competence protein ComEC/Rec2 [Candidatus Margulisiibacteriota bacterium]
MLGIIAAKYLLLPIVFSFILLLIMLIVITWLLFIRNNIVILLPILFILIGFLNYQVRTLPLPQNDISNIPQYKMITVIGLVENVPNQINNNLFFNLAAKSADNYKASGHLSVISPAAAVRYGDIVKVQGRLEPIEGLSNPSLLSFVDYLQNNGIYCRMKASAPPLILQRNKGNPLIAFSQSITKRLMVISQKTLPAYYATLQNSIILGTGAAKAPPDMKDVYKKAGVAHLLVVSGMQVALLAGVCLYLTRIFGLSIGISVAIASVVNWLFVLMTGGGASILRAALMAEIMLIGLLFEKEGEIYNSLFLSLFILLLFDPKALFDIGLQLSYAATASLIYISPVLQERLAPLMPKTIAALLAAAVSPILATIPITIYYFGQFSLIGLLTNILLLPWINCVVVLGFLNYVLGILFFPLAQLLNNANLVLLMIADGIVNILARAPFAQAFFPSPKFPLILAYYLGLIGTIEVIRRRRMPKLDRFRILILILLTAAFVLWNSALSDQAGRLTITVLDIGQGDSILIESPTGKRMLVDGGKAGMGEKVIIPLLHKKGINYLDIVSPSHQHDDHLAGICEVLQKVQVGAVIDAAYQSSPYYYQRFMELIQQNHIKRHVPKYGQWIDLGGGARCGILYTGKSEIFNRDCLDVDNRSIAFKLVYGKFSMLFTGDNEKYDEEYILQRSPPSLLSATILKVGHHGSYTSTSAEFLTVVNPRSAIISCGLHNKFRHPHPSTLKKLAIKGIPVYRTDKQGAITIKSDGSSYTILTQK